MNYALIDSGDQKKLELFGSYRIVRPCPQALWNPAYPKEWKHHHGEFLRDPNSQWKNKKLPSSWNLSYEGLQWKLMPTSFGHLGIFPEHAMHWKWMENHLTKSNEPVLNLFAYSGGTTLFLAQQQVPVCHVDASKGMVSWARENSQLNNLENASIRWIVDDALQFLKREIKRGNSYQGIVLDPPSFGRGNKGQVFKIERDLLPLLECAAQLVDSKGFILLTAHTPGVTATVLQHLLLQTQKKGKIESGEMVISSPSFALPSGSYARWHGA